MSKEDLKPAWKKGQSGNPEGRPKGAKGLTTQVREALLAIAEGRQESYQELLVKKILKKAIVDGNERMIQLIWNYMEGKPKEKVDMNINGNISFKLSKEEQEKIDNLLDN